MNRFAIILLTFLVCFSSEAKRPKKKKFDSVVTISTAYGDMVFILFDETPKHKANFIALAQKGYYDSTTFHRVIKDFMIQGGDPNSKNDNPTDDGQGGPGYTVPAEFTDYKHVKGALAAARKGDMVNPKQESSGSQFYIVHNAEGTPHLDGHYTVFGILIKGMEVIDKIANAETGAMNRPMKDITMKVTVEELKRKKITKLYGYTYEK